MSCVWQLQNKRKYDDKDDNSKISCNALTVVRNDIWAVRNADKAMLNSFIAYTSETHRHLWHVFYSEQYSLITFSLAVTQTPEVMLTLQALHIAKLLFNIRRKFLPCRILTVWNSLPANTDFSSLAAFRQTVFSIDLAKFLQCNND